MRLRFFAAIASLSKTPTMRRTQSQCAEFNSLFNYTSGRWLWNERVQLATRSIRFDVEALKQAACRALRANNCIALEKIGEGNFNKAFRLTMDDGRTTIAKLPHPNSGPATLTTSSEVATMDFARSVLNLPVPKVLDWSATEQNPIQSEYILMEEAKGSQLGSIWHELPLRRKIHIIKTIVDIETKMMSASFDLVGSLYFTDSRIPGCTPITGRLGSQNMDDTHKSRFSVGPITRREFWEKERAVMTGYHGPWTSSAQYLRSVADREIEWICKYAGRHKTTYQPWQYVGPLQLSVDAHVASLEKFKAVIPDIVPRDIDVTRPRFWHPDFHLGNIYLDEMDNIISIIDWQGAWNTPPFIGINPPPILDYGVEVRMKLPDNFKLLDGDEREKLQYQVSQSVLITAYETQTARVNPSLYKMMRIVHGQTLKQLEAFANATWDNCLYPFNECLLRVQREWSHFNLEKTCPYCFSDEETRRHLDETDDFNDSQRVWQNLRGVLTDDGYTTNEDFPQAVKVLQQLQGTFRKENGPFTKLCSNAPV